MQGKGRATVQAYIAAMTASAAVVFTLPSARSIVLVPEFPDTGLIAHRLSKNLRTVVLSRFETDALERLLETVRTFWA
jgi:hypothetical protein